MNSEKISLILPPDSRWLEFIDHSARCYWAMLGFDKDLQEMLIGSVHEASEEFIRICDEKNIGENFEICLDFKDDAAIVQFIYSGRVPLNPHETDEYEVPISMDALDSLNMDTLWLHLIKQRMDRVFFRVAGTKRILQMSKYLRETGKARQFWVMGLTPKLREDLRIDIQAGGGGQDEDSEMPAGSIIQDSRTGTVLRLDAGGTFIVQRLDGKRTFQEIYMEYIDRIGMTSPKRMAQIFERLEAVGMLEAEGARKKKSKLRRVLGQLIHPNFSIPRADAVVTAAYRSVRFMMNPVSVSLLLLMGLSGIIPIIRHGDHFLEVVKKLDRIFIENPWYLLPAYLISILKVIIHEFGHGITCKHFGGRVDRMGIMFYLAFFIFFCDTSAAWNFSKKSQRILVSLGGPITSFFTLGVSLWICAWLAGSGSPWEGVWIFFVLMTILALVMNFNPFIRMDSYYMLMDWTGIANLRTRSFAFLEDRLFGWMKKKGRERVEREVSTREKIIFWSYGVSGVVVSVAFVLWPLVHYGRMLIEQRGASGVMTYGAVIIFLIMVRVATQALQKLRSVTHREYKLS